MPESTTSLTGRDYSTFDPWEMMLGEVSPIVEESYWPEIPMQEFNLERPVPVSQTTLRWEKPWAASPYSVPSPAQISELSFQIQVDSEALERAKAWAYVAEVAEEKALEKTEKQRRYELVCACFMFS